MADCSCSSHGTFLTAKGLEEAAQRHSLEGLAPRGVVEYVDKVVSVRGLVDVDAPATIWPSRQYINQQRRRHLNGY